MTIRAWALAFLPFLILTTYAHGQPPPERIVITYPSRSIASIDLYIAQERGFFLEEGLLAEVVQVREKSNILCCASPLKSALTATFPLQREVNQELGLK
jgi:ABC-type nitrate/sulfonate/bicarbonate transport system substrate-binding protein